MRKLGIFLLVVNFLPLCGRSFCLSHPNRGIDPVTELLDRSCRLQLRVFPPLEAVCVPCPRHDPDCLCYGYCYQMTKDIFCKRWPKRVPANAFFRIISPRSVKLCGAGAPIYENSRSFSRFSFNQYRHKSLVKKDVLTAIKSFPDLHLKRDKFCKFRQAFKKGEGYMHSSHSLRRKGCREVKKPLHLERMISA